VQYEAGLN